MKSIFWLPDTVSEAPAYVKRQPIGEELTVYKSNRNADPVGK